MNKDFNIKTFCVKYENNLSFTEKIILESFKMKLYYYVIDDILYLLGSNKSVRNNLLSILNSAVLYLHNTYSINIFDIYVYDIYTSDNFKYNKFHNQSIKVSSNLNIKLAYPSQIHIKNI